MDKQFVNIQQFMVFDLKLSGNDLIIYAIIYGFSQDGKSSFHGGLSYLKEWTNSSKNTVLSSLKFLCDNGLIAKYPHTVNGINYANYKCTKSRKMPLKPKQKPKTEPVQKLHQGGAEIGLGVVQKLHQGGAEIAPNNKEYNKVYKKEEEGELSSTPTFLRDSLERVIKQKEDIDTDYFSIAFNDQAWLELMSLQIRIPTIQKTKYLFSCFYCFSKSISREHASLQDLKSNFLSWSLKQKDLKINEFKTEIEVIKLIEDWINKNFGDFKNSVPGLTDDILSLRFAEYTNTKYNSIDMALFAQNPVHIFRKEFPIYVDGNSLIPASC